MKTTGIILAAGLSRRMGSTNKLLMPWRGKPLLRHVADAALGAKLDDVMVVTGHEAVAVAAVVPDLPQIHAEGFADGMGASLSAGARAAGAGSNIMILLGDMPLVTTAHINTLLQNTDENRPVVAVSDEGHWGHPVLFPAKFQQALAGLNADSGARHILAGADCVTISIGQAALRDFDTPDSFKR